MKASIKDFEIMAPVGSRESLAAAIQAGADSIYFGIESLNMRARSASTFTVNDLREIAQICDKHGIKSYLTINTIIYDEDIALMRTIVDAAKEAGISAVIAADVAVMAYCCEVGQEVHLSTQLNISNAGALKFYARFADVVVLARELNLKQVRVIYDTIQKEQIKGPNGELVRIEMFCHGALCMAVSGKCYLSLHEMNASANRGACMQICRRAYDVHQDATYLPLDLTCEKMNVRDNRTVPMVSATASKNKNGVIHISLSNVDADNAQEITVNLPDVNAKKAIGEILTSANLTDYNSFEKPNIVKPASFKEVKINKGIMKVKLPAKSIVTLELQ